MLRSKIISAAGLAISCSLCSASLAQAQVRNYDTMYPFGAAETIRERGIAPHYYEGEAYMVQPRKWHHHHFHKYNDTVYGRTLELDIGMGGAHLD